jgi:putative transposase
MIFYRRILPHWHPEGAALFLTWRLYGSLPASHSTATIGCATDSAGKKFKLLDAILDKAASGPKWLNDPRIAQCVFDGIHTGAYELRFYNLHAFVIMPNHVHLLISPKAAVPRVMNGLKGVTAHRANSILRRSRNHFWQDESFDHWVRSSKQFDRIRTYIEFNPVSTGLAASPQDWPWSSANPKLPSP